MKTLPATIVAEAFALSNARGADLLVRLGAFGVWRGDLSAMRGDDPPVPQTTDPAASPTTPSLVDTLVLSRAIELLPPTCRAALAAVYLEHGHPDANAARCEQRLLEIYDSLTRTS